jgi:hypothetical protein
VAIAALAPLASLSFACPPGDLSSTCRFAGDATTACGQCVAHSCQPFVDSCCADDLCGQYDLPTLDKCTGSGDCGGVSAGAGSGDAFSKVASCVKTSCSGACGGVDAGISTTIACSDLSKGTCRCVAGTAGAGTTSPSSCDLSASTFHCCAETNWPTAGTACACSAIVCASGPDSCGCGYAQVPDGYNEVAECQSTFQSRCCKGPDGNCLCQSGTDCGTATEVQSCRASDFAFACAAGSHEVSTCP